MKHKFWIAALMGLQFTAAACSKKAEDTPAPAPPAIDIKTPAYQFTTTNWDDGWVSTIKADWVEVSKGSIKVLLHYPQAKTTIPADPTPFVNNAWDILVAPRYSNLQNYAVVSPSMDFERAYLGNATVTENASGKTVYVALFKKANSGWIEVVTPDKKAFVQQFGIDPATIDRFTNSDVWNSLRVMANYNRFAVAAVDIAQTGKWSNSFSANTYYYSMYTGLSVGMSTYSAAEEFVFNSATTYNWQLFAANSAGGGTSFAKAKSSGSFSLKDNWNIAFSDIEGKPKTYPAWFAGVKGGRVLFINGEPFSWVGK